LEISVAEKIESIVPSAEMIRFYVSGTEATMHAIKIARAYTGKEKILKFEGQYHGVHDYVSFSTAPSAESPRGKAQPDSIGIPKAIQKLTLVNQWNDFDAVEKTIRNESSNIAAIITEPVMANAAVIPPQDGYLKFLKELCDKNDIVLIFDEVKTGFRISKGGAQELFGVKPHLTALAKSFGNGYPISAVVGLRKIMKDNANRKILHQGTYARNPVSLAAADATIDEISKWHVHRNIERFGAALMKGITDILHDRKIDGIVQGYPSMFQVLLTKQDSVNNYREFLKCDREFSAKLQERLLKKGVMFSEPSFTCASHDSEDLQQTLEAFDASLQDSASSRSKSRK
jgi:glutamate-1-semialdehyde 2,1-aminomutase